jgi:hypothetical protein
MGCMRLKCTSSIAVPFLHTADPVQSLTGTRYGELQKHSHSHAVVLLLFVLERPNRTNVAVDFGKDL